MAYVHELKTYSADNGSLTVLKNLMPGAIQRVFYIYDVGSLPRAGHRHHRAWNVLVCLGGSCRVYCHNGREEQMVYLNNPRQCLVLEPEDWHLMDQFSPGATLLVVSNEPYDQADYITEPYPNTRWLGLAGPDRTPAGIELVPAGLS